ncbi:MAG: alanine racemase [Spirochaetaceae bacterium]|jgi:alanine racemase|nr:alanine racemase [Spirochaetaceae bacterium]
MRATKVIIDLDRFRGNIRAVRDRIGPGPFICVPVKADAYGHGAVRIAGAALSAGVRYLAVATVREGAELRDAGITAPILLLSIPLPEEIPDLVSRELIPLVGDRDFASGAALAAERAGKRLPVHLKIDTGMGRVGCRPEEAAGLAAHVAGLKSLEYAGTATHLASADSTGEEDARYTREQLERFTGAVAAIRKAGFDPGIVHAANTGAVAFRPEACFDMVRPGILLYGYPPAGALLPAAPVMKMVTRVVFMKKVRKGETVSYGRTWTAPKDTVVATLPVGYGDGLPRGLSGNHSVLIRGRLYPLVGRICMDQCMADLGPAPDIDRWEEVAVFGGGAPSAADIARKLNTIPYEITCNINKRVPRVYPVDGSPVFP